MFLHIDYKTTEVMCFTLMGHMRESSHHSVDLRDVVALAGQTSMFFLRIWREIIDETIGLVNFSINSIVTCA